MAHLGYKMMRSGVNVCAMTSSLSLNVASNVRAELARRGMSQKDLADALGLTQTAISNRVRGVIAFDVDELASVAQKLGVRVESLIAVPEGVES